MKYIVPVFGLLVFLSGCAEVPSEIPQEAIEVENVQEELVPDEREEGMDWMEELILGYLETIPEYAEAGGRNMEIFEKEVTSRLGYWSMRVVFEGRYPTVNSAYQKQTILFRLNKEGVDDAIFHKNITQLGCDEIGGTVVEGNNTARCEAILSDYWGRIQDLDPVSMCCKSNEAQIAKKLEKEAAAKKRAQKFSSYEECMEQGGAVREEFPLLCQGENGYYEDILPGIPTEIMALVDGEEKVRTLLSHFQEMKEYQFLASQDTTLERIWRGKPELKPEDEIEFSLAAKKISTFPVPAGVNPWGGELLTLFYDRGFDGCLFAADGAGGSIQGVCLDDIVCKLEKSLRDQRCVLEGRCEAKDENELSITCAILPEELHGFSGYSR